MKLSLEDLKDRVEAVASKELLGSIAGGIANGCHIIARSGDVIIYQQ